MKYKKNNKPNQVNKNNEENIYNYPDHILDMLEKSEMKKLEGKFEEALDIAQKILLEDTECIPALEEVADNLLSLGKHEKAEKTVRYILSVAENSYTANYIY